MKLKEVKAAGGKLTRSKQLLLQKMAKGIGKRSNCFVLFSGENRQGKMTAAAVMAKERDMNVFRVDTSSVVSKYIGETEKNLRRLFDQAERSGAILFFDEADALFGKRTTVKDSHDRYANMEINYLLKRMESFRGVAILATNSKSNIDPAFLRRFRFVVEFRKLKKRKVAARTARAPVIPLSGR
ncbi:ATP-binding protein [Sphingobacteriales bacterium CHB3]|nr:ATP-binding protein [Sphingobacteriales bacterium CHB3]